MKFQTLKYSISPIVIGCQHITRKPRVITRYYDL
ncbi:hypothetical protein KSS87_014280 [Heliosperma pusillum]|nr:hypothetical protein KSS87_022292 [Heliosperma pusillum]KAH9607808.1 hypothetical protein KSS87_014280 [Heliosperma pusillum]